MLLLKNVGHRDCGHPAQGFNSLRRLVARHDFKQHIARFFFAQCLQHHALSKARCAHTNRIDLTEFLMKRGQHVGDLLIRYARERGHGAPDPLYFGGFHVLHQLSRQGFAQTQHQNRCALAPRDVDLFISHQRLPSSS